MSYRRHGHGDKIPSPTNPTLNDILLLNLWYSEALFISIRTFSFLSCSTRMVSSVGRGQIIKEALLRTFFFLLKNAVTRRCFHKSSQLHFTAEWASLQSVSVPARAKILNHWISQLPSFVLALLHMKHTEWRRESLWALFLNPMQGNVDSAENMAGAVYDSCQQHLWLLRANVCDQRHQNGAKSEAVHTDKLIMKQQTGAPAVTC